MIETDADKAANERRPWTIDLTGKVAMVTGASRGMGREMARGLALAGADVAVVSRRAEACNAAAAEITGESGRNVIGVGCNVSRWEHLEGAVDEIEAALGPIDILVNNAGSSPVYDDVTSVAEALYDKVFDLNLKGPFRLMCLVGPRMAARGWGSIVNVSSHIAEVPMTEAIPYSAAKSGVENMTKAFAHRLGPQVRVNCIRPGAFLTEISDAWDHEWFAAESARYALKRGARPDECVGAVLFLASDASSYMTGAVLALDGGMR